MDIETDDALIGVGKLHRVMVWDGQRACDREMLWGLPSREPGISRIALLKSETMIVDRPCLLLAAAFGLLKRGTTVHAASLMTDQPFFCIAAVWRPPYRLWPETFAALTVPAYDDIAAHKDRHVAVVRSEDGFDWLTGKRMARDILRPFPRNSFDITPPIPQDFDL